MLCERDVDFVTELSLDFDGLFCGLLSGVSDEEFSLLLFETYLDGDGLTLVLGNRVKPFEFVGGLYFDSMFDVHGVGAELGEL